MTVHDFWSGEPRHVIDEQADWPVAHTLKKHKKLKSHQIHRIKIFDGDRPNLSVKNRKTEMVKCLGRFHLKWGPQGDALDKCHLFACVVYIYGTTWAHLWGGVRVLYLLMGPLYFCVAIWIEPPVQMFWLVKILHLIRRNKTRGSLLLRLISMHSTNPLYFRLGES